MHSVVSRSTITLFRPLIKSYLHTNKAANMVIQIGDKIPSIDLFENLPTEKVNLTELCHNKKLIIFAVPGAFTPGCSKTHLPGYISDADLIKSKGIAEIICISVNDPFVMQAWGNEHKAKGKVRMLADTLAEYTTAIGMNINLPPLGGMRSKRYSMVVENGIVKDINVEPDGTGLSCSLAQNLKI